MTSPIHRLVRLLLRQSDVPSDARIGVALRAGDDVVAATVQEVGAGTIALKTKLANVPTSRCVLTIMVDMVARIDLPVRLERHADGMLEAHVDGTPLVMRRRISHNARLAEALAAA